MHISGNFDIVDFLRSNGYPVKEHNDYISFPGIWRNGSDVTSVTCYPKDNLVIDWVENNKFSIEKLIQLITNKTELETNEFIKSNNISFPTFNPDSIKQQKIFDIKLVDKILPIYDYFLKRGISEEVLKEFKSGIFSGKGRYNNKFCFPVFNSKNQLLGLIGRAIDSNSEIRWIISGQKSNFVYPAHINQKDIKEKNEVILVEGISDAISLFSVGIRNVLVLFGTDVSFSIINFLLRLNISDILISTNSDAPGIMASEKIYRKLTKYFNKSHIKILLPNGHKDWNEILINDGNQEILEQLHKT